MSAIIAGAAHRAQAPPSPPLAAGPAAAEPGALVVHEGEPIRDLETVRLLLRSILRRPDLPPDMEATARSLFGAPAARASLAHCTLVLRQAVMDQLRQTPGDTELLRLLQQILAHELETQENRLAYATAGRDNPNAVWWPNPTSADAPRRLADELPWARTQRFIDRATPIGSAGSCFAMEIANALQAGGYRYVRTEPSRYACANWGPIFNAPAFRQLVERAFGLRTLPRLLWAQPRDGGSVEYRDPFREEIAFESVAAWERDYEPHRLATRAALEAVEVFVITLGVNEVWYLKSDGSVFSRNPWRLAASLVERRVLTVEDNVRELQAMLDLWRAHNPRLTLIVSVSPVPLLATFRGSEQHVVAASCHSKSTLRVAAEIFAARNPGVHYFPSYETVLTCSPDPWEPDGRHVSRAAVGKVMRLFEQMFVREGTLAAPPAMSLPGDAPVEVAASGPSELAAEAAPAAARPGPSEPAASARELDELEFRLPLICAGALRAAGPHPERARIPELLDELQAGYRHFAATGETPASAYEAMRRLSYVSNGYFNEAMQSLYGLLYPPTPLPDRLGPGTALGLDEGGLREVIAEVEAEGFAVLPSRLDAETCARLLAFARRTECEPQSPPAPSAATLRYDPAHPVSVKYAVPERDLVAQPDVQRLIADPSVLAVAQGLLGCTPVLALTHMWWSTALLGGPDSTAAQLFHFDMDQSSFLKIFFYLTDVTAETGPHCFVRGSHRDKPLDLRRDGRIADAEVLHHYGAERVAEIAAPRGTVIVANTRGLHKGKHLAAGDRCILQLVFASSLFGAPYETVPLPRPLADAGLRARLATHARTYWRLPR